MSRVLVTGATGFVGRHALTALVGAGHDVHAVSTVEREAPRGVTWHRGDLLAADTAQALCEAIGAEQLLHLAWFAEPGTFWTSSENLRWVEATLRLLRAFVGAGGTRAVLAGTCAEYQWGHDTCEEGVTPLIPGTLYGSAKHAVQLLASAYARQVGIELAWGRIFFLYGPGEPRERLVPAIALALLAGQEAPATSGSQVRDFMHVQDVSRAFVALLDSHVEGPVNVASGTGVRIADVIECVAQATGRSDLVRLGALEQRDGDPPRIVASVRRLQEEVGFSARWGLEAGIEDAVAWWRAQ